MQFLDWLDRHFTSNSHFYFYADELCWPLGYDPQGLSDGVLPGTADMTAGGAPKHLEPH